MTAPISSAVSEEAQGKKPLEPAKGGKSAVKHLDADLLPFRPRDWVANDDGDLAKVKTVIRQGSEVLLDLFMYDHDGTKVGRRSLAFDGPRTYEPCCSADGWYRITTPEFPLSLAWQPDAEGRWVAKILTVKGSPLTQGGNQS